MAKMSRIRIEDVCLPDAGITAKEAALRVMLVTSIQIRSHQPPEDPNAMAAWIGEQLERIFNAALNSGAFDKAKCHTIALDDLCAELGLFGITPYVRKVE